MTIDNDVFTYSSASTNSELIFDVSGISDDGYLDAGTSINISDIPVITSSQEALFKLELKIEKLISSVIDKTDNDIGIGKPSIHFGTTQYSSSQRDQVFVLNDIIANSNIFALDNLNYRESSSSGVINS